MTDLPAAETLRDALRKVVDPEAGINIVELGLVYALSIDGRAVHVDLTMTSPACPMGEMIVDDARRELEAILPADASVDIRLVWEPPWSPERMSDSARSHFGWEKE